MLTLPYPGHPANGDAFDATAVQANQNAITQAIQSFDGSQVVAGTIQATSLAASANPQTLLRETSVPFVYTGLTVANTTGLIITISGGTFYYNGVRIQYGGLPSATLPASKDVYLDLDANGNLTQVVVNNGATAGMNITANTIRIAKVVTGASTITSITQSGSDPIGNVIYPVGANSTVLQQNPVRFSVYKNASSQTWATSASLCVFDAKEYDYGNNFSTSTNLFTAPYAGLYQFYSTVQLSAFNGSAYVQLRKNGNSLKEQGMSQNSTANGGASISHPLELAVNDTIGIYVGCVPASQTSTPGSNLTYFSGYMVARN